QGFRGAAFWAWAVSIGVHLIVLSVFGVVRFSKAQGQDEHLLAPTGRIGSITQPVQAAAVMPKPKMSEAPAVIARSRYAGMGEKSLPLERIFSPAEPIFRDWHGITSSESTISPASSGFPGGIEFFSKGGGQRKVCYLVDCSGSMQGIFEQVREKLKESITALQPDQYFYLIFFGDGRLYEIGDGKLLRATPKAKAAAGDFVDSIRPEGRTNAAAALERVVQIQDGKGISPSLVYFLTDGFELTGEDTTAFPQRIANLLEKCASEMKINTIAFLPQADDRIMLETIARQSGGEFLCIGGK
ncbi:MAG: VWA domain-containing protein, partial [Sedimentisphaerales bacterium]|nr:VWA domain-containing protein [Sedimentisphaerales bacterium]